MVTAIWRTASGLSPRWLSCTSRAIATEYLEASESSSQFRLCLPHQAFRRALRKVVSHRFSLGAPRLSCFGLHGRDSHRHIVMSGDEDDRHIPRSRLVCFCSSRPFTSGRVGLPLPPSKLMPTPMHVSPHPQSPFRHTGSSTTSQSYSPSQLVGHLK